MRKAGILVVEDDISFALELEMMIIELGYKYLGNPRTSIDASKAIASERPDLIIMDINIRGKMDGITLAEKIQIKNIPIIFITGFESSEYFDRAQKILPAGYLVKPFHLLSLRSVIKKAFLDRPEPLETAENIKSFVLRSNNTFHKVSLDSIMLIQVDGNYCYFFTKEKKFVLKLSLKRVLEQINQEDCFLKIHRKFVIHKSQIKNFNAKNSTINLDGRDIAVGRQYKSKVMEILKTQ